MLDEDRVYELLADLQSAHQEVIKAAERLEMINQDYRRLEARTLYFHEFEGKNAQQREWEAETVRNDNTGLVEILDARFRADIDLARAKADLDIVRESISLWRALAYQEGGGRA